MFLGKPFHPFVKKGDLLLIICASQLQGRIVGSGGGPPLCSAGSDTSGLVSEWTPVESVVNRGTMVLDLSFDLAAQLFRLRI